MKPVKKTQARILEPRPGVGMAQMETSVFVGPLPTPEMLRQYEEVHPGIAERILGMAEREQNERHAQQRALIDMEGRSLRSANWNIIRGQIFAITSVLIIAGLCGYIAYLGHAEYAANTAKWVIVSLAGIFVVGRVVFRPQKEPESK